MFKRYKPYEENGATTVSEEESPFQSSAPQRRSSPYVEESPRQTYASKTMSEPPPRIFDRSSQAPTYDSASENLDEMPTWVDTTPQASIALEGEQPETTLGEGVTFKGELAFQRLLRIDGTFEGDLISKGKLVVGPKGHVKSDNIRLREAIIEGFVEGNITVEERIELRSEARVRGNIKAQSISVDEGVSIVGHVTVAPYDNSDDA
jgi:cytoskeletal protein CcmA (bactofilin family)